MSFKGDYFGKYFGVKKLKRFIKNKTIIKLEKKLIAVSCLGTLFGNFGDCVIFLYVS